MTPFSRLLFGALGCLAAMASLGADAAGKTCDDKTRCEVEHGYYLVHAPKGWDGKSALPTLVYLHGWLGSAEDVMKNDEYIAFADEAGLLLVAPHGEGNTWSFKGSPGRYRDEIAYLTAVLDDVEKRFPVKRSRLWASGFSQGGSMVWYAACYMANRFAAFAPISGAFWHPMPTECTSGPVQIRHVHGLADQTVPMQGRQLGGGYRQGSVREAFKVMRKEDGCGDQVAMEAGADGTRCERSLACSTKRTLMLCLHDGDHFTNVRFLRADWQWVKNLPANTVSGALN